jgi:hypothetical protein
MAASYAILLATYVASCIAVKTAPAIRQKSMPTRRSRAGQPIGQRGEVDAAAIDQRFAEICLGVARGVVQQDKHLPPSALLFAHVDAIDRFVSGGGPRASATELLVRSKYFRHSIYQLLPATTCHILPTGRRAKRFP